MDYSSVRYTQEYANPYFSNGAMSVSQTYVALANGFLDPASLAPITIFEYDGCLYCIDTRRLMIAKELQKKRKFDVLKHFPFQFVTKGDHEFMDQYNNLVNERLPAMKKKGLDGLTIKLNRIPNYSCCYNSDSDHFRDDLDEHIACYHFGMDISDFKGLNVSSCDQCYRECHISVAKISNRSGYGVIQNCSCSNSSQKVLHTLDKPWTEITLQKICDIFRSLKKTTPHQNISEASSISTQLKTDREPNEYAISSLNQGPFNVYYTAEEKNGGFIKWLYLFSIGIIIMGIIYCLIFTYYKQNGL